MGVVGLDVLAPGERPTRATSEVLKGGSIIVTTAARTAAGRQSETARP